LRQSKKLTDVWVDQETAPRPQLDVNIDGAKARALGVEMKDIFNTLQVYLGSVQVNDFNRFGRTWQIIVMVDAKGGSAVDRLLQLQVRTAKGEMVRLGVIAEVKHIEGPGAIQRVDMNPALLVSANPASGTTPAQARAVCESQFEVARQELRLPAGYRLIWRVQ
jgi:multidrug efflux pump subunit AcrB